MRNLWIFMVMFLWIIVLYSEVYGQSSRTQYFETWSTKKANQNLVLAPTGTGSVVSAFDFIMSGTGQIKIPSGTTAQRSGSPSAGMLRFNSDNSAFEGYDGTAWGSLGGGGVGAPYIYEVYDFEGAVQASSFTCDSNFTATDDTSTPLKGNKSLVIAQGATPPSVGAKCTGSNIAVPVGARGLKHVVYIPSVNGFDDSDIAVNVYDVTNAVELGQVPLKASTTKNYTPLIFQTASTTANIRIEFEVLVQNASASAELDDIYFQDRLDPVDVYASSDWETYTPTITGLGTVTNNKAFWKQEGDTLKVRGWVNAGTPVSSVLSISLPPGLTIDSSKMIDSSSKKNLLGYFIRNESGQPHASQEGYIHASIADSSNIVYVSFTSVSDTELNRNNGTAIATGDGGGYYFEVPIQGWSGKENFVAVKGSSVNDAANSNDFTAVINDTSTCVTQDQTPVSDWLSCSVLTTNQCTCTVNSAYFSVLPTFTDCQGTVSGESLCDSPSGLSFRAVQQNSSGTVNVADTMYISMRKKPVDFVPESERQIIFPEGLYAPTCYVKDVKISGTNGGASTANTVHTRDLNTTQGDCSFLSLSSNQFTLDTGTYQIEARTTGYECDRTQAFIYNTTDSSYEIDGLSTYNTSSVASSISLKVSGQLSFSSPKTLELRQWVQSASSAGLGFASNGTNNPQSGEVYSVVKITKLR